MSLVFAPTFPITENIFASYLTRHFVDIFPTVFTSQL
nr:MAG TPA: hypothetical protein [Caudoviricetes sp.]